MSSREGWHGITGCLTLVFVSSVLYFSLRTPRQFSSTTWQATDPMDRMPMARDFVERGLWRGASRSDLEEWLGERGDGVTEFSWPLPEALVARTRDTPLHATLVIDRPRLVLGVSGPCCRLMIDQGVRGSAIRYLVHLHHPLGLAWSEGASSAQLALAVAALRGASEGLTDLSWFAGSGGFIHAAAILHVRLVEDRAIAAWIALGS